MHFAPKSNVGDAELRDRALGIAIGLGVIAVLVYADIRASNTDIVVGTVVLGPLLASMLASPRDVALVGVVATAAVLISGAWNHNFAEGTYFLRAGVVVIGSIVSTIAAARRETVGRDRGRFELLSAAAEIGTGTRSLRDTASGVTELIVPAAADVCIIDVVARGEISRLAVETHGSDAERVESAFTARPAAPPGPLSSRSAIDSSAAELVERVDDDLLGRVASDEADLSFLRSLRLQSIMVVPLVARGRALGAMTLCVTAQSGRRYSPDDLEFVHVLGGRVALALDNAGLFAELETIEAQLSAAMSGLAEAVTIQHAEGALVYANDAAARLMGFETPQELLSAPVSDIIARFSSTHEDGTPISPDEFPGRRLLAGETPEPLVSRAVDHVSGEERWRVTKATPVRDRHGRITLVVNVIEDITDVKLSERAQRILAQAGEVLGSSLEYERTLQGVAELAVPDLADWCSVGLPDGRGRIRTVAVAHPDPQKAALAREIAARYPTPTDAPGGAAEVLREGVSLVVNDVTPEMVAAGAQDAEHEQILQELGMRAAMVVPIRGAGRVLGTLALISAESGRTFTTADIDLAEELGRRAGNAVENARLYAERSRTARTLQSGLMPEALPAMPGWRAETLYRPAEAEENWVGGDFFDAVPVPDGWLAIIGDVAGRGAEAAALTALARHTLRATAKILPDPLDAIARLNDELLSRAGLSLCSVGAALLRERDGLAVVEVVCAGHPQALVLSGGSVRGLGVYGPIAGAFSTSEWARISGELDPGDTLILYTDGVLDAVGAGGERFGEQRLRSALAGAHGAHAAIRRIDTALQAFQVGRQADDTAVLAIEREPVPASAASPTRLGAGGEVGSNGF